MRATTAFAALALVPLSALVLAFTFLRASDAPPRPYDPPVVVTGHQVDPGDVKPLPAYLGRSLNWLASAQFEAGGWGAGMHASQDIRDPHAVQMDPATTSIAALALMRAGSTPADGPHADNIRRALDYLLAVVEQAPPGARITTLEGTQPQVKLGGNIDAALAAQFFAAALPHLDGRTATRAGAALDKCLLAIQRAQASDGSQGSGGWAPVLQSAMANSALERGQQAGRGVDEATLRRSREYQRGNVSVTAGEPGDAPTASVDASAGAGVALYAATASQRATAQEARTAATTVRDARGDDAPVTEEALREAGYSDEDAARLHDAYTRNEATAALLDGDDIWTGFGNNGGEEYLSYMMTSESLVIAGGEAWDRWHARLVNLFAGIQNQDGSWSGLHCITSPVFSTAAVILALTADRDQTLLAHELDRG